MAKKRVYSWEALESAEAKIPKEILEVLSKHGWNILGIYEAVEGALLEEKKAKAKQYGC